MHLAAIAELEKEIVRRKSVRKYEDAPLDDSVIDALVDFLSGLEPPMGDVDWDFDTLSCVEFADISTITPSPAAPHYLVLRGERKFFSLQNAGYIGEMAALWLRARDIGSCWLSVMNTPNDFEGALPYCGVLAFGSTSECARSDASEFERKGMDSLAMGDMQGIPGKLCEAARLAPTAANKQPVRLMALENRIHVFRKKPALGNQFIHILQSIDVGIALAHIAVEAAALEKPVRFERQSPEPKWGSYIYQMSVLF